MAAPLKSLLAVTGRGFFVGCRFQAIYSFTPSLRLYSHTLALGRVNDPSLVAGVKPNLPNEFAGTPTLLQDGSIQIEWPEPFLDATEYSNMWLRDHCQCCECRHHETKQRLVDPFTLPQKLKAKTVKSLEGENPELRIQWEDGHESCHEWLWLRTHSQWSSPLAASNSPDGRVLWDKNVGLKPPSVHYDSVMESDDGLKEWLVMIRRYGFCFIDACPVSPEKSQKLLERIAYIRHTHYGGFYDFTSNLSSKDMAYTNLSLPAHTDTAYFEDPAGLQMFHLLSHTDGEGGASLLVDGFRAAKQLMMRNQRAYEILRTTNIYHHSSGNPDFSIRSPSPSPVISANAKGHIKQIRWNNEDRTTLHVDSGHIRIMGWKEALDQWYDAASELSRIMKKEESEYWEQLRPGRALVFDNWRVLHGRSAFTGKRRICGGYINHADYCARYQMLIRGRDKILRGL